MFYCSFCKEPMRPSFEVTKCTLCGKREKADYLCPQGHYICEDCRLAPPDTLVKRVSISSQETDPMRIAILLMKHPAIQMHGPAHHYLVSNTLLSALRNLGEFKIDELAFDEATSRGKKVPLGACGLWGVCGAAASVGIAVSIATKATMMSSKERSLSMQATSEVLSEIAKMGGPRCCKASTFVAIETGARFFEREFGIKISLENPRPCFFKVINNKECLRGNCPYWE